MLKRLLNKIVTTTSKLLSFWKTAQLPSLSPPSESKPRKIQKVEFFDADTFQEKFDKAKSLDDLLKWENYETCGAAIANDFQSILTNKGNYKEESQPERKFL